MLWNTTKPSPFIMPRERDQHDASWKRRHVSGDLARERRALNDASEFLGLRSQRCDGRQAMSEKSENSRLEAFCDGVFAIAITLLVLDIKIPLVSSINSEAELRRALLEAWPSWFGFLLTFMIIFIAWVNHHAAVRLISKSSPQFIYANGFMLLTVVVLPFSAGLMAEYLNTDHAQTAVTIYCFGLLLHNVSWIVWGWTALHPHSLAHDKETQEQLYINTVTSPRIAFVLYLGICIVSFWFPYTAMVMMTASWLVWVVTSVRPGFRK
jgi:uncharacterized membrane protein